MNHSSHCSWSFIIIASHDICCIISRIIEESNLRRLAPFLSKTTRSTGVLLTKLHVHNLSTFTSSTTLWDFNPPTQCYFPAPRIMSILYNAHNLFHVSLFIQYNYLMICWSSAPLDSHYISPTVAIMVYVMLPGCTWWLNIECIIIEWLDCTSLAYCIYLARHLCSSICERSCSPCSNVDVFI